MRAGAPLAGGVEAWLPRGPRNRLHLTVAPVLIGSGRPSITLDPITSLDEALRPACRRFTLGEDMLFDLDLRSPHPPATGGNPLHAPG